jgi:hypothetical protein
MSYADYTRHRPEEATCRLCGWSGVAGEDCDCEEMEEERIAAVLREQEEADEDGTDEVQA